MGLRSLEDGACSAASEEEGDGGRLLDIVRGELKSVVAMIPINIWIVIFVVRIQMISLND